MNTTTSPKQLFMLWEVALDNVGNLYLVHNTPISQPPENNGRNLISLPLSEAEYQTSSMYIETPEFQGVNFVVKDHFSNYIEDVEITSLSNNELEQLAIEQLHVEVNAPYEEFMVFILHPCIEGHNVIDELEEDEFHMLLHVKELIKKDKFEEIIPY